MRLQTWRAERCPSCQLVILTGEWADWRGPRRLYHPACAPTPLGRDKPVWGQVTQITRALDALEEAAVYQLSRLDERRRGGAARRLLEKVEKLRRLGARAGTVDEGRTAIRQAFRLLLKQLLP